VETKKKTCFSNVDVADQNDFEGGRSGGTHGKRCKLAIGRLG
jgi:hypothetical protein